MGKTDTFKNGYVKVQEVGVFEGEMEIGRREFRLGDYLVVRVDTVGPRALYCSPIGVVSTLNDYYDNIGFFSNLGASNGRASELL